MQGRGLYLRPRVLCMRKISTEVLTFFLGRGATSFWIIGISCTQLYLYSLHREIRRSSHLLSGVTYFFVVAGVGTEIRATCMM